MIAAWMLFAIELSALLFISAWIAERALRQLKKPVRGVWVAALAGANLLPVLLLRMPAVSSMTEKWALSVAPDGGLSRLSNSLVTLWVVAATIGLIICVSAVWRMGRTRNAWRNEHVDNTPVLVSHDVGPALVGVMQYSIVLPQWACSLEQDARRLLLAHEREHARKFDPMLLTVAALAVVAAPWNVFNWLFFRRLHLAVELDCDQRVLRAHPDTRSYGALLLDVAERVLPSVMPAAAFVEHGASLETRIDAMSERKKPYQSLRVASGLALSLVFAAAACFTPRPYAIIIVNPPATAAAQQAVAVLAADQSAGRAAPAATQQHGPVLAADQSSSAVAEVLAAAAREVARSRPVASIRDSATRAAPSALAKLVDENVRSAMAADAAGLSPVAPSAATRALDYAEIERMRLLIAKNAPRSLGNFARADSALVLLLNDNGVVRNQTSIPLNSTDDLSDAMRVFSNVFLQTDVHSIRSATMFTIERGADNEPLRTPLRVFVGYQHPGMPPARRKDQVRPSAELVLEAIRQRHPNALTDRTVSSNVVMILFDTQGAVLKTASVPADSLSAPIDGDHSTTWRKLFGAFMDSGTILDHGSLVQHDANIRQGRPLYAAYATMQSKSEFAAIEKALEGKSRNWTFGSTASRPGTSNGTFSFDEMLARTRLLVHTRVPDAYGHWSRADSAVIFLLDANNQLIARKAGPIPSNRGMQSLADYISLRVLTISGDEIQSVGWANHVASESGRVLDKPLVVIWGRISAEATRKRELARQQREQ